MASPEREQIAKHIAFKDTDGNILTFDQLESSEQFYVYRYEEIINVLEWRASEAFDIKFKAQDVTDFLNQIIISGPPTSGDAEIALMFDYLLARVFARPGDAIPIRAAQIGVSDETKGRAGLSVQDALNRVQPIVQLVMPADRGKITVRLTDSQVQGLEGGILAADALARVFPTTPTRTLRVRTAIQQLLRIGAIPKSVFTPRLGITDDPAATGDAIRYLQFIEKSIPLLEQKVLTLPPDEIRGGVEFSEFVINDVSQLEEARNLFSTGAITKEEFERIQEQEAPGKVLVTFDEFRGAAEKQGKLEQILLSGRSNATQLALDTALFDAGLTQTLERGMTPLQGSALQEFKNQTAAEINDLLFEGVDAWQIASYLRNRARNWSSITADVLTDIVDETNQARRQAEVDALQTRGGIRGKLTNFVNEEFPEGAAGILTTDRLEDFVNQIKNSDDPLSEFQSVQNTIRGQEPTFRAEVEQLEAGAQPLEAQVLRALKDRGLFEPGATSETRTEFQEKTVLPIIDVISDQLLLDPEARPSELISAELDRRGAIPGIKEVEQRLGFEATEAKLQESFEAGDISQTDFLRRLDRLPLSRIYEPPEQRIEPDITAQLERTVEKDATLQEQIRAIAGEDMAFQNLIIQSLPQLRQQFPEFSRSYVQDEEARIRSEADIYGLTREQEQLLARSGTFNIVGPATPVVRAPALTSGLFQRKAGGGISISPRPERQLLAAGRPEVVAQRISDIQAPTFEDFMTSQIPALRRTQAALTPEVREDSDAGRTIFHRSRV